MASSSDNDPAITLAKLAEQAERYEDMKAAMVGYVNRTQNDLNTEERNLISVAFKNIVGAKRSAHRILSSVLAKETAERKKAFVKNTVDKVWKELEDVCGEMLTLLDKNLIPKAQDAETKVFYYKMKGDYLRYLAEGAEAKGKEREKHIENSKQAYEMATKEAESLTTTNPIRLGLALNFSVFFYEILNKPDEACSLAKSAFDDAIADLDNLEESKYKDSTLIMQLLRDNLTLWTSNEDNQGDDDEN